MIGGTGVACDSPRVFSSFSSTPSLYYPLTPPPAKGVRERPRRVIPALGYQEITCHLTSIVRNVFHLLHYQSLFIFGKVQG